MLNNLNRVDSARNDLLITSAGGEALRRLSEFYGFQWPTYIPEADWRAALIQAVFATRGPFGSLYAMLLAMFNQWSSVSTLRGTATSGVEIALDQESLDFSALTNYVNRLAVINGTTYFVGGVGAGSIVLADVNTGYFNAANLTVGDTYEVKLLPFFIEEHSCVFKLLLDGGIFVIPSTYLQTDATQDQNIGEPPYGFMMDFFSQITAERFGRVDGPFPAYLATDFFEADFYSSIFKMLAAGVQLKAQNVPWSREDVSMYSSLAELLNTGSPDASADYSVAPARV